MKTLITGAGGFIGFHLARRLLKEGHAVRGLFMPGEETGGLEDIGIEIARGDLTKPGTIAGIADGIETVFHLAARTLDWGTRRQFESIMVEGTKNLLAECSGRVKRFVYFSSVAAMGLGRDLLGATENAARKYCGIPYCDTKIMAEDLVSGFCPKNGMEFTIVRPTNVTGPGSVWVTEIIEAFQRGPVPLIAGGKAPGAFVYIDNLVDGAVMAAGSDKAAGRVYFFRDDYPLSWKEYLEFIGGLVGKKPSGSIPFALAWQMGRFFEAVCTPLGIRPPVTRLAAGVMGKNAAVDCSRAKTELGWTTHIDQDTAMSKIRRWVHDVYLPSRRRKKEIS